MWFVRDAWAGGNSSNSVPLWHLRDDEASAALPKGTWIALCGYEFTWILNGYRRRVEKKTAKGRCKKCQARLEKQAVKA